MSTQDSRTIGFFCPKCHQSVIAERSVFALCAAPCEIPCPCGGSRVRIRCDGEYFSLEAPCASCGGSHTAHCPRSAFLRQRTLGFSCPKTGLDCCYVGEHTSVFAAMRRLELALDQLDDTKQQGAFLNETVMREMLGEVKDIAARGGISCSCGSKSWSLRVHYASVELVCEHCGGTLRLRAATMDDLEDLCCRDKLLIGSAN